MRKKDSSSENDVLVKDCVRKTVNKSMGSGSEVKKDGNVQGRTTD